jgi:hypothetical protein
MNYSQKLIVSIFSFILVFGCAFPGIASPTATEHLPISSPTTPLFPPTSAPKTETPVVLPHSTVDPSTMTGKLLMGYQGWFTCPGDGTRISNGYYTWIRDGFSRVTTESYGMEMWADTSELSESERCPTDLKYPDGSPAYVYSAVYPKTVLRHFQWMSEYGIDGVFLQRFGGQLLYPEIRDQRNFVTSNVLSAAEAYGRVWAIMYDVTGMNEANVSIVQTLEDDWKYLVDVMKVTQSPAYLHHNGLPVVELWGLGFEDRPGTPGEAAQLVDFFENNPDPKYRVTLVGGVPFWWRTLQSPSSTNPAWADYYCSVDIISPWAVGAFTTDAQVDEYVPILRADIAHSKECGAEFMPVVFPGHSYHSADPTRPFNQFPRRGGRLYWRQIFDAITAGSTMIFNAMFDEINEGTAMYKLATTAESVPTGLQVITMDTDGECLPNDWYLRLAGEATKMLRGEISLTDTISITPPANPTCKAAIRMRMKISTTSDWTTVSLAGVQLDDVQIVSSSPGADQAIFDPSQNNLVLTQPIPQANAGQSIELVADLFPARFTESTFIITIGRGNIGATNVEIYAVTGSDSKLVKTLQWSGLGSDGRNLKSFEVPSSVFSTAP